MRTVSESVSVPGLEGARRATGDSGARAAKVALDPEVTERAKRRRFTAEYKLRILRKADACKGDGPCVRVLLLHPDVLDFDLTGGWDRPRKRHGKNGAHQLPPTITIHRLHPLLHKLATPNAPKLRDIKAWALGAL